MYMINLRQDGINGNAFSETTRLFDLTPSRQIAQLSSAEFMQAIEQKTILILVHGFNQSISDVLSFYLSLEQQYQKYLGEYYGAVIGLIWPGGEADFSYSQSKQYARRAGYQLQSWMHRFYNAGSSFDVMTHATGSLVVYYALQPGEVFPIHNFFSLGAALHREVLEDEMNLERISGRIGHMYVFYTKNNSPREHEFSPNKSRQWLNHSELGLLGEKMIRRERVTLVNCSNPVACYPGYRSLETVSKFMVKLLSGHQYPQHIVLNSNEEFVIPK